MKILSLFDGISCARVALDRVKIPVEAYYASEIDKYARQIAVKNYPATIELGDIKNITGLNGIDLLIGGSPCQDLSIAGKRKGLSGERSGLFYEYVRILKEVKPKYFILENVASMSKEAKDTITKELFGIEPVMINASLVSAQNRKRLFWVGKLIKDTYQKIEISQPEDKGILLKDILEDGIGGDFENQGKNIIKLNIEKSQSLLARDYKGFGNQKMSGVIKIDTQVKVRKYKVDVINLKDILILSKNKLKLSNKQISERLNKPLTLVEHWFRKDNSFAIPSEDIWFKLKDILKIETDIFDKSITEFEIRSGKFDMSKRVYPINSKAPTLTTLTGGQQQKIIDDTYQIRKLTPIECERLQGLPDNYTEGISNTQRYKCLGNAFNVDVVAHILKHLSTTN